MGNIAFGPDVNELTWGDCLGVLRMLLKICDERAKKGEKGVAMGFRLEDEGGKRELEYVAGGQLTGRTEWWTSDISDGRPSVTTQPQADS